MRKGFTFLGVLVALWASLFLPIAPASAHSVDTSPQAARIAYYHRHKITIISPKYVFGGTCTTNTSTVDGIGNIGISGQMAGCVKGYLSINDILYNENTGEKLYANPDNNPYTNCPSSSECRLLDEIYPEFLPPAQYEIIVTGISPTAVEQPTFYFAVA